MENLKIRVNNEAESKEAQELFFKIGATLGNGDRHAVIVPGAIGLAVIDGLINFVFNQVVHSDITKAKEITLPELRAMVNPMKEYLVPDNGGYRVAVQDAGLPIAEDWMEIPEGAECAILVPDNIIYFWKSNLFIGGIREDWVDMGAGYDANWYLNTVNGSKIIWKRATHPEELPFIDDEPKYTDDEVKYMDENGQGRLQSINDQYAEIEQVRQHKHYFKDVSGLNEIDVYMVLKLFNVTDPCLQHIAKKALCAGQRGHKDFKKDLQDILDTANRAVEINN